MSYRTPHLSSGDGRPRKGDTMKYQAHIEKELKKLRDVDQPDRYVYVEVPIPPKKPNDKGDPK